MITYIKDRLFIMFLALIVTILCFAHTLQAKEVEITHKVTFDIKIGNKEPQTVVIGLFGKVVPITVKNFLLFARKSGFNGYGYSQSKFHRVVKNFVVQGGDVVSGDGYGSVSIYGGKFNDENFDLKHTEPGLLSMANSGPNSNGSQFFITTVKTPWLDGKHTVFGKVIDGMDVVKQIENVETDLQSRPIEDVVIVSSKAERVTDKTVSNQ